ncbi:AMMECR1 domain-containing protein [Sulfurimonas sp.]|uniref:AMMECR1 domain-containing protein n=1 Tax=Sulfurimonas sp. TaxID=2022749 RepID=UPI002605A26F|nr:AMMECR1 domain-containing protein [Sulfurimonas sp.]
MGRSVLLQLARDSIEEVLQAQNSIDKDALLAEYALLAQNIPTITNLYINNELRGSYTSKQEKSLVDAIIIGAKRAAFEDKHFSPLTTSEYLSCEIELILETPDGILSEKDKAIAQLP